MHTTDSFSQFLNYIKGYQIICSFLSLSGQKSYFIGGSHLSRGSCRLLPELLRKELSQTDLIGRVVHQSLSQPGFIFILFTTCVLHWAPKQPFQLHLSSELSYQVPRFRCITKRYCNLQTFTGDKRGLSFDAKTMLRVIDVLHDEIGGVSIAKNSEFVRICENLQKILVNGVAAFCHDGPVDHSSVSS